MVGLISPIEWKERIGSCPRWKQLSCKSRLSIESYWKWKFLLRTVSAMQAAWQSASLAILSWTADGWALMRVSSARIQKSSWPSGQPVIAAVVTFKWLLSNEHLEPSLSALMFYSSGVNWGCCGFSSGGIASSGCSGASGCFSTFWWTDWN